MKWNKEICEKLANNVATIVLCDGFNEDNTPNLVFRKAAGIFATKKGRDSHYGVCFDEPLSEDNCTAVSYQFVLAYSFRHEDGKMQQSLSNLITWLNIHGTTRELSIQTKAAIVANVGNRFIEIQEAVSKKQKTETASGERSQITKASNYGYEPLPQESAHQASFVPLNSLQEQRATAFSNHVCFQYKTRKTSCGTLLRRPLPVLPLPRSNAPREYFQE
jgi:uncharacterized protein YejL (UPF0352 family)